MKIPLIAGNWKMNNSVDRSVELVRGVHARAKGVKKTEIVVAPPFTALQAVSSLLSALEGARINLSSQNIFWEEKGAFTGEISPSMLTDIGCRYGIIGHSERRQYFGETDETVNKRARAALSHGLRPIVCVGETLDERESAKTTKVVERQLRGALEGIVRDEFSEVVIAYEPVWAIGTGKTATPDQAEEVHLFIRKLMGELFGDDLADKIRVLYGGSMNPGNAADLLSRPNIDGGLVGGASLKEDSFAEIILASEARAL